MTRKRILRGVAAASVISFLGGLGILLADSSASAIRTPTADPSSSSTATAPAAVVDPTTSSTEAPTTTTAAPATTTSTAAPTTTRPAAATTATARSVAPGPTVSGPGTVQLLPLPSGDADGKTREVWVYRP